LYNIQTVDINIQKKLDSFFNKYKIQKYKKGEILIRADDEPSGVFYLKEGIVKMYAISSNGEELTINIYKPISLFPMSWVFNSTESHHYYEAMTSVTVWKSSKEEVLNFLQKEPSILLDLLKRIYRGLEGYFMRMEYLMKGNAQDRVITELLIYARRFGENQGNAREIKVKLTEKNLASQSGIARETVSREVQKLKKMGLLTFQKSTFIINDLQKLEAELLN